MKKFTTRLAKPEDAEAMVHLQRHAVEKAWRPIIKENFDAFMAERFNEESQIKKYRERVSDPQRILVVVEKDNQIIGFAGVRKHEPDEQPLGYGYQANALYVDPDSEGRGIGSALLNALFDTLGTHNAHDLCLWCLADNRAARNFYEKHGGQLISDAVVPTEYAEVAPHVAYGWTLKREQE